MKRSPEGVALMQLAEALIRLPPEARGMPSQLVRDKLASGDLDFFSHIQSDKSLLINASSLALSTVQGILDGNTPSTFRSAVQASGLLESSIRRGLGVLGRKFTLGPNIETAVRRALRTEGRRPHTSHSFDMLGEGARTWDDASRYLRNYRDAASYLAASAATIHQPQMSVKLSSLCPRFDELSRAEAVPQLVNAMGDLVAAAGPVSLFIDAEEQRRLEMTLAVFEATVRVHKPESLGIAVQAYGRRAIPTLEFLEEVARANPQTEIRVRLVKGAYWDAEIKEAQVRGADMYPVWTSKRNTDVSYLACAAFLLNSRWLSRPAFATHNTRTVADILAMTSQPEFLAQGCEFQRLHGMGESFDYSGMPLRVYAPTGTTSDLLAYLVRRMLENGANSSFLKQLADGKQHLLNADVLVDQTSKSNGAAPQVVPAATWTATTSASSAAGGVSTTSVPRSPRALYNNRLVARGVDYEHPSFAHTFAQTPTFAPTLSEGAMIVNDNAGSITALIDRLNAWNPAKAEGAESAMTVGERAAVLRAAADIMEAEALPLSKLVMEEAGKTIVDAVNEVREAIDFFRFYANQAEETMIEKRLKTVTGEECVISPQPRGPWLCVGPFNFPFAIVGGLATSTYVAGNPVVIKPHPATPRCAAALVDILRRAGMRDDAMTIVLDSPCNEATRGSDAGQELVASGAFAGVSFVGSTTTAAKINYQLATNSVEKGVPLAKLVAETGGLNALVADSSALPEQVCDAVIASFAGAAGQRCSSARLLLLDAGAKNHVMRLVSGALKALRVSSDNMDVSTDVGPLINDDAAKKARDHCERLEAGGATLMCTTEDESNAFIPVADSRLFHPRVYKLPGGVDGLKLLKNEVFAPVLHVIEYDGLKDLERIIDAVNEKGFALTGGVLTRCESVKGLVKSRLNCGNMYINRDCIGAVVESQPFGGHGLSGNGVKAGGEGYLEQFVSHKIVCEDTTAAGGDLELLRSES